MDVYDPRAVELLNLKLALAAFATRLNEFEARVKGLASQGGCRQGSKKRDLNMRRGRFQN
jgi:hypothetical protein